MDGLLAGYIQLQPKDGWNLAYKLVADPKQQFGVRFAVARTLRFYHGWQPKESRAQVLYAMSLMIPDGDVADLAIEDLRQWQTWDLSKLVFAQYGRPSHSAPILKNAIVRYALCCPQPEARDFVDSVRRREPDSPRFYTAGSAARPMSWISERLAPRTIRAPSSAAAGST